MKQILFAALFGLLAGIALSNVAGLTKRAAAYGERRGAPSLKPLEILNLRIDAPPPAAPDGKIYFNSTGAVSISYDVAELMAVRSKGSRSAVTHIRQDLIVRDKKGNIAIVKPSIIELKKQISEKPARFINEISLHKMKNLPPGDYEATILVADLIGFQTAKGTLTFSVVK